MFYNQIMHSYGSMIMSLFRPKPSALAEWYDVVIQAQSSAGYCFDDCLQHYLVLTLDHFTTHGDLVSRYQIS